MSRKLVHSDQTQLDELPMFKGADQTDAEAPGDVAPEASAEGDTTGELNAALESLDEQDAAPAPAPTPRRTRRVAGTTRPVPSSHGVWLGLGVGVTLIGLGLGVVAGLRLPVAAKALEALGLYGVTPSVLLVLGLLCWGIGLVLQRQVQNLQESARLENSLVDLVSLSEAIDTATRQLQESDAARAATPATSADDLGQVMFALQRTDEKIVNLTKATKTFGKPLVEITTQLADAAAQVVQSQAHIQALKVSSENGMARLEESLRKIADARVADEARSENLRRGFEELRVATQTRLDAQTRELQTAVEGASRQLGKQLEANTPDTGALEAKVAAISNDIDEKLAEQGRALQASLEQTARDLAQRLAELAKAPKDATVNLTPIQNALAELRRDVANLASGIANAPRAAAATVQTPSSTLSTPTPAAAPAAAPAAPAAAPARDDAAAAAPAGPGGLAQSIAGEHKPKGNVMGAIAKLKKLRG